MEFKRFVQVLHPIIGGASSHGAFAKTLFDVIIDEKDESVLDEQSDVTYRAYFSGTTGISRIARISPYIETENFVKYISEFSDQVLLNICDSFHEYLPEITPHNAGEQLAELFLSIIMEAASRKRKKKAHRHKNVATRRRMPRSGKLTPAKMRSLSILSLKLR